MYPIVNLPSEKKSTSEIYLLTAAPFINMSESPSVHFALISILREREQERDRARERERKRERERPWL
jgi:hypothetical protein